MVVPLLTKETRTWHEATPADEIEQRRSLRVFSDHRNAGDMVLSFLRLTGDGQLEIVWQDDQGSLHDLDADLHEYFRAAGDLVGWFGWQSLYADVRLSDDRWRTCRESLETLFEEGPRLLPPFDVDRYRARFAARL